MNVQDTQLHKGPHVSFRTSACSWAGCVWAGMLRTRAAAIVPTWPWLSAPNPTNHSNGGVVVTTTTGPVLSTV